MLSALIPFIPIVVQGVQKLAKKVAPGTKAGQDKKAIAMDLLQQILVQVATQQAASGTATSAKKLRTSLSKEELAELSGAVDFAVSSMKKEGTL